MSPQKGLLIHLLLLVIITVCHADLDVGFILDSSGSIVVNGQQNWDYVLNFVAAIINGLPRWSTRIGAVAFGKEAQVLVHFDWWDNSYPARDHILSTPHLGGDQKTNTSGGLYIARTLLFNVDNGDRRDAPNIVIVITDGRSDTDRENTIPMAEALQKHGVKVYCIGITNNVDINEVAAISSPPRRLGYEYYRIYDFTTLHTMACTVIHNIKDLQINEPDFEQDLDIGFILDGSGRGSDTHDVENWNMILDFIGTLIDNFPKRGSRIGVLTYGNTARVTVKLDQYKDLCEAKDTILRTSYPAGQTNTSGALYIAHTQLFNINNGDRGEVPNVAILIANSRSDIDTDKIIASAETLHQWDVQIICVGIGSMVDEHELRVISSPPQEKDINYFQVTDSKSLIATVENLMIQMGVRNHVMDTVTQGNHVQNSTIVGPVDEPGTSNNVVLHIVVPVIGGLLLVLFILLLVCIIYRKKKKADTEQPVGAFMNHYENQVISTIGKGKQAPRGVPVYDEAAKAYIYEEAAPANIYDDASSTHPHPQQPVEPECIYSNATGVHPPIYELAERSDGAYSQVNPSTTAQQQQPPAKESLYSQVQRKGSYIYAQVQKKRSYIYAHVNKVRKRNTDDNA